MGILRTDTISGLETPTPVTGSVSFDGSGDYLSLASSGDFALGTDDWTVEWFAYPTSSTQYQRHFYLEGASFSNIDGVFADSSGIAFGRTGVWGSSTASNPLNQWNHYALVHDSTNMRLYINGVQVITDSNNFGTDATKSLNIGYSNSTFGGYFTGNISNFRILKGTALYTSNFTPPTTELEVTPETVLLCCHDGENIFAEKTGQIIAAYGDRSSGIHTVGESPIGITTNYPPVTRGVDVTAGPVLQGNLEYNSQNFLVLPKGTTEQRGRGRAVNTRGYSSGENNVIEYTTIASMGNAIDFGDLTDTYYSQTGGSDVTRGVFLGGYNGDASPDTDINVIEYLTFATTGNAVDFGDTHVGRYQGAVSSPTRILSAGGNAPRVSTIDFITTKTLGSTASFGNLTESARGSFAGCCQSSTRGVLCGGQNTSGTTVNDIQYVTMASAGDSVDFGDLIEAASNNAGGSASSSTRGIIFHGYDNSAVTNVISYITIATTGSNANFGDLTEARQDGMSASSTTRGMFIGGRTPTYHNTIDYVTISSTGNAQDFGDITALGAQGAACSDSHGGLS